MADKYANIKLDIDKDAQNSIAFWFPKIKNCGIPVPETLLFEVPMELRKAFYMEDFRNDQRKVTEYVETVIRPAMREANIGLPFLKNGGISDKFNADTGCLASPDNIDHALINIMQTAMMCCGFQYDGTDVIAVRERIRHDPTVTPSIYHGLPFRPEYRVFYDFDSHEVIFIHDYWDKDYIYPHLHDLTDKIVFDAHYPKIRAEFEKNETAVSQLVADAMASIDTLEGPWSVDIMQDETGKFWLIDMAIAPMSAYWHFRPGRENRGEEPA